MKLALRRSDYFSADFDHQYRWYLREASEEVAERYYEAVNATLDQLARQPELGHRRQFRHPELKGLRSFAVRRPFGVHPIFYRHTGSELFVERIMHGARNLPRRLIEPPATD